MPYLQVAGGFVLLVFAGDFLVRGSVALASRLGISTLVIGTTVVAFGTSAPELVVSIDAVLSGVPTLALGNVVGSNIANVFLVIGLPAIFAPMVCGAPRLTRNMVIMIGASLLFVIMCYTGGFTFAKGLFLLVLLATYLAYVASRARTGNIEDVQAAELTLEDFNADEIRKDPLMLSSAFIGGGLIGLAFGAHILIEGAVTVATELGVSEAVIGLSLVALGTSLPELVTAIVAAIRGHCDVAVGNVIGSNIFNLLGIIGVASLIGPIPVPDEFLAVDLWVMMGAAAVLLPFAIARATIGRAAGLMLVICYVSYIVYLANAPRMVGI